MFMPVNIHEILGCTFIAFVVIHNIVNRNFYRSIPHGKITKLRLINCVCMFIFSLSLGALIFSGVALSNYVFSGLNIPYIMNWRAVHLASAIITLFVLFIHLLIYINRYIRNKSFKAVALTLFVIAADHYVYGYSDPDYVAEKKGVAFDRRALQNTPLIIWTPGIEHKEINTICDTADVLPTVLNLLGIEYDPNNYIGDDIFSDTHDNFVWFSDGSNIKGKENELSDDAIRTKTKYNISKNKDILLTNYYGVKNEK